MTRNTKALLFAAAAIVMIMACIKAHATAVRRRSDERLAYMIQLSVDAAGARNQQAVRLCETELNTILAQQLPEVQRQGQAAAEDLATYQSCGKIIYSLARDKLKGSDVTGQYVGERMQAHLRNPLKKLSSDLEAAVGRFELSLRESTVGLARDLAQLTPCGMPRDVSLPADLKPNADADQALANLGVNGVVFGASLSFDVWAVLSTRVVKSLTSSAAAAAARMFARPAATAAAEVTVALADGPLPVGDIIAAIGGLWTAYDVYATRKQFEREMMRAIDNMMPNVRRDIQRRALEHVRAILKEHQRMQDAIRRRSVQEFEK